ncbi:hypothetical protein KCP78_09365 [Salmonella enterica subsp. enterica]|nr:hypothetical protein KCP78_09365 [Salmonella enterica subsp. enterica]
MLPPVLRDGGGKSRRALDGIACQHLIHQVSIVTPSGVTLCLNVESPHIEGQQAIAAIRKDGAMMGCHARNADFRPRYAQRQR